MSFEKNLLEAIDEAFYSIGNNCNRAIYEYLEKNFMLNKLNIPKRIEDFSEALDRIFGFSAKILELNIMNNLYRRTGNSFKYQNEKTLDFITYIQSIKNSQIICLI